MLSQCEESWKGLRDVPTNRILLMWLSRLPQPVYNAQPGRAEVVHGISQALALALTLQDLIATSLQQASKAKATAFVE